jgi:signal transduction histidine kinase
MDRFASSGESENMKPNRRPAATVELPETHPVRTAMTGAAIYVAIALAYIVLSGHVAAAFAGSLEALRTIEAIKGVAFVVVTGLLFFFISLGWWRTTRRQRDLLIQSERRAVAAMYGASLAHDLNNMLMGLHGLVEALKVHEKDDEFLIGMRGSVEHAIQTLAPFSKRLASMAKEFRPGEKTAVDLAAALGRIVELARKHPAVRFCALRATDLPPVTLDLHVELLEQAVLNLIVNAAQAAGPKGRIELRVRREARSVCLEVHDDGPGIPPEKTETIFAAGYTTKQDGSGLGLLSVQAFAASCRAGIAVERSPLGGAVFRLVLPATPETAGGVSAA